MTSYQSHRVNLSDGQKDKIKKALNAGTAVSITLSNKNLHGNDLVAFTKRQMLQVQKALQNNTGVTIKMSKTQIKKNLTIEGGFLGALAGLAARAVPVLARVLPSVAKSLGIGALTGLASTGVQKALGSGLYLKKGGNCCKIETDGKGLYLKPTNIKLPSGDGLYDGKGLLLGANSPFKSIPLLNILL